ncbi:MAG: class I SAM-dependent methyltransferase [Firmicutes bacterium]|nr:class I SAM-dependent methyltransferase [Bacillota bacterium]
MWKSDGWSDYELLDCTRGERLERWGEYILIRPDPQVIWKTERTAPEWERADARYIRSEKGGGSWEIRRRIPERWRIKYGNLTFGVRMMGFKHTGVFPEQSVNWERISKIINRAGDGVRILNLFAYTGCATVAAAAAGASVCHVDASKGMVAEAKENARLSGLSDAPIRYIVDDCLKFVEREGRRGHKYEGIIMDPPSYGRGPSGEVWHLEESIHELIIKTSSLLSDDALFFLVNSYTTGLSPMTVEYMLGRECVGRGGVTESGELTLPVKYSGGLLPCGASAWWLSRRCKGL